MATYSIPQTLEGSGLNPEKPMFPISVVADILKVHQRTLRIYDDETILVPNRSPKNRRLYSFNDIERGKFIQYLTRELGINLAGIKIIFHLLGQQKIEPSKYLNHISEVAKALNISAEAQQENRIKLSRRGRKATKNISLTEE
ncbi:MAG: MerR family transcriptional regulator [Candidatus Gastranaerophilales bacterium]|nr:MerR family transcriptional regulator [Candidatus Gastranaerophilales bacterium]